MPQFPERVWDGKSPTRTDLSASKNPDASDWQALSGELQAAQNYLLLLASNMHALPNLPAALEEVECQLTNLKLKADELSVPDDVVKEVADLRRQIAKYDLRESHNNLRSSVKRLFIRLKQLDTAFKAYRDETTKSSAEFQAQVRNQLVRVERQAGQRIQALEAKVAELQEFIETPDIG